MSFEQSNLALMLPKRQLVVAPSPISNWEDDPTFPTAAGTYIYEARAFRGNQTGNVNLYMLTNNTTNASIYIFRNCVFNSSSRIFGIVSGNPGCEFYFINCVFFMRNPRVLGFAQQRVFVGNPKIFEMTFCTIVGSTVQFVGTGIQRVFIKYNRWININGLYSNGPNAKGSYGWDAYVTDTNQPQGVESEWRQAIQFNGCPGVPFIEIEYNEVINQDLKCSAEDIINFFANSGGTSAKPALIQNNFMRGGGKSRPYDITSSAFGIQLESRAHWITINNNIIVETGGGGISLDSGSEGGQHDITISNNRVVSGQWCAGISRKPQSTNGLQFVFTNAGTTGLPVPTYGYPYNIHFSDNYSRWRNNNPAVNAETNYTPALAYGTNNTSVNSGVQPGGRAPVSAEDAEEALWKQRLQDAGIPQIGSSLLLR